MNWHEFIFSNKRGLRTKRHILFWLLWWIYFAATYYYYVQVGQQQIAFGDLNSMLILKSFLLITVHIISCYYFIYFLLPRYLLTLNYLFFAAGLMALCCFLVASGYFIHASVFPYIDQAYQSNLSTSNNNTWWTSINTVLLTAPKIIAAAAAIKLVKRWYLKQKEKEKVEKEMLVTELKLLKAQVRPDFFFGSLDHIYRYAKVKSPMAPELLLKFADLLSYMLYECDDALVSLDKEISMMIEFMEMEKLRFDNHLEMGIDIKGDPGTKKIAPLVLLPFIENSFRLCNSSLDQTWINLELSIEDHLLIMKLMNGTGNIASGNELQSDEIINVQKRLQLLYPGEHELKMYTEQEICMTLLKINLYDNLDWKTTMPATVFNNHPSISTYAHH
jgi:two-component system LytT family sensor kinase